MKTQASPAVKHHEYNGYAIVSHQVPKGVRYCPNGRVYIKGQKFSYDCPALELYNFCTLRSMQSGIRMKTGCYDV